MGWEQVSPSCWVATSGFCQLRTVIVRGADGVLLVDPGVTGDELGQLASELSARGWPVVAGFATHPHWDHLLWSARLGAAPRYATPRSAAHLDMTLDDARAKADRQAEGVELDLLGRVTPLDAPSIPWNGPEVRVVAHDAHAPGHGALHLPDEGVLVAGDMLSDVEVPLLDLKSGAANPLGDYRDGLDALAAPVAASTVLVPGHGRVATGDQVAGRLAQDRTYLDALAAGREDDPRLAASADPPAWLVDEHRAQLRRCGPR